MILISRSCYRIYLYYKEKNQERGRHRIQERAFPTQEQGEGEPQDRGEGRSLDESHAPGTGPPVLAGVARRLWERVPQEV